MVKRNLSTEAKKAYSKPALTRNEPLVNITFATAVAVATTLVGYVGSPQTLINTPNIGIGGGDAGTGMGGGTVIGSGGGGLDGGIGGAPGGATLIGGGTTLITGTGGAPGTVL